MEKINCVLKLIVYHKEVKGLETFLKLILCEKKIDFPQEQYTGFPLVP